MLGSSLWEIPAYFFTNNKRLTLFMEQEVSLVNTNAHKMGSRFLGGSMKRTNFYRIFGKALSIGLVAFVLLAVGMAFVGCDHGTNGDGDVFAGTWIGEGPRVGAKIIADNGSYTEYQNDTVIIKATYSVAGNPVTIKMTHVNPVVFGGTDGLVSWADLDDTYKGYLLNSDTFPMTIENDTLVDEGGVGFRKQK